MDGLGSFTGMRGFPSRGQLEAWMAGVGSSTVRLASGGAMEVRRRFTGDSVERESSCVGLGASLLRGGANGVVDWGRRGLDGGAPRRRGSGR